MNATSSRLVWLGLPYTIFTPQVAHFSQAGHWQLGYPIHNLEALMKKRLTKLGQALGTPSTE